MMGGEMADEADEASSAGCRCDLSQNSPQFPLETLLAVLGFGVFIRRRRHAHVKME